MIDDYKIIEFIIKSKKIIKEVKVRIHTYLECVFLYNTEFWRAQSVSQMNVAAMARVRSPLQTMNTQV